MFDYNNISDFRTLIGFRQNAAGGTAAGVSDLEAVAPYTLNDLLQSDSGYYYNDAHPLITLEHITLATKQYHDQNISEYLNRVQDSAIRDAIKWTILDKKVREITKNRFDNNLLFTGAGSLNDIILKRGRFVGFKIKMINDNNMTIILNRIGTQFTSPQTGLDIYLYHSSQQDPIGTITLNTTAVNSFAWTEIPSTFPRLRYHSRQYDAGGFFLLGYYENDLVGQAINKKYTFGKRPCGSCNRTQLNYWNNYSQYMSVIPVEVSNSQIIPAKTLFDIDDLGYSTSQNWGINLDMSSGCDLTDYFIQEKHMFVNAIYYHVAKSILTDIAYSSRNNTIEKQVRQDAMYELERKNGIIRKLKEAQKELSFDTSDLGNLCMPCNTSTGLQWSRA